ncbi:MAG: fumarylacetoacetate hydrolase family protein [Nocardioides sp.]|uniref:fumarylacetoacetate hydrolase family protein n=1 Tax=Nocardioides sp. TaxID=35761 RepID=UPI0039E5D223
MRLAAFRRRDDPDGARRVGLVVGDDSSDGLGRWIHPFPDDTDLVELLAADPAEREALADLAAQGDGLRLAAVILLPPVYPVAMRDFLTFEAHVDGMERGHGNPGPPAEWYDAPVFLFMAPHAVTGPYDDIAMPPDTERFDFELEIAAIVCRDVCDATPEQALAAIGGYCVMNDWSARDVQSKEMTLKLGPSKGKDFATTIGPWVVTPDELDDCRDEDGFLDLKMTVKVNDEPVGADRSAHMGWSFEQLVSHASRASWVKAGEVLASGTCSGGSLAEAWGRNGSLTPPPLQVGDVVEMTIERLGTIRNRIVETGDVVAPVAPARRRTAVGGRLGASA